MKIAVVTGAANGIGKSISQKLAVDGYYVVAVDVDENNGKLVADEIGKEHSEFFKCNIVLEKDVIALFDYVVSKHKQVDVLVNNAGIIKDNLIHKMSTDDFNNVIDVNLKGTWLMCRGAAKIMREQKSGRIINISSRAWLGNLGQSNYSASKGGIVSLTRVLALELGRFNILVNAIAPGLIDTPLTQSLPKDVLEKLIQAQPTKTIGKPDDIAIAVSFLADEKTQFITGQTIYVDGGKSIGAGI